MIPNNGISAILDATKTLFSGVKPLVLLLLGVILAFLLLENIVEMFFKRAEEERETKINDEKISQRILGAQQLKDIEALKFLSKELGLELESGWEKKIKMKTYENEFARLTEHYGLDYHLALPKNFRKNNKKT